MIVECVETTDSGTCGTVYEYTVGEHGEHTLVRVDYTDGDICDECAAFKRGTEWGGDKRAALFALLAAIQRATDLGCIDYLDAAGDTSWWYEAIERAEECCGMQRTVRR
jgi:hypothetical protein